MAQAYNREFLIRALVRAAKARATTLGGGATILTVLAGLLTTQFNLTLLNGRVVVSTAEAGGSVTFATGGEISTPEAFMALVEEALEWVEQQPDPNNPNLSPRHITRLRATFENLTL